MWLNKKTVPRFFSTFDSKIRQHGLKEPLEISKDAKLKRDLWKTKEDVALQNRRILLTPIKRL